MLFVPGSIIATYTLEVEDNEDDGDVSVLEDALKTISVGDTVNLGESLSFELTETEAIYTGDAGKFAIL